MSGFENDVMFALNADFTKADNQAPVEANGLATDGQMWIGTTTANAGGTHINVGEIISSTLAVSYSSPNIVINTPSGLPAIQTINGDTGSITGSTVTIFANQATLNSGSSVRFDNSGTTSTFSVTDTFLNTLIGQFSGNNSLATPGAGNVGLGYATLNLLTTGVNNVAVGFSALGAIQDGSRNTGTGYGSLSSGPGVSISDNTSVGYISGGGVRGNQNTSIGSFALSSVFTGSNNISIGYNSSNAFSFAESSNIIIGNDGVTSESNAIRIGTQGNGVGQQDKNFQAGITGVTVAASEPVAVASTGQLSGLGFGTAAQVLTSNGAGVSPTWQAAGGGTSSTFSAYLSADAVNVTGNGTDYTIIFNSTIVNQSGVFNTATGEFTAPNTGNYDFSFNMLTETTSTFTASNWFLNVNGSINNRFFGGSLPGTSSYSSIYASSVLSLTAGDKVTVSYSASTAAGTLNTKIFGGISLLRFSGFQIA